jgi:type I restriction enzyme R subunit
MAELDKKLLSERDICTKFITPALQNAGWELLSQIREQVYFTKGRIIVRGKLVTRGKAKFADYILYYRPNLPIALIEAKDNSHPVGGGLQEGLEYAATLDIPFVFSSNGDAFLFHDRTGLSDRREAELSLDAFPSPEQLWKHYRLWKGVPPSQEEVILQGFHDDASGKEPRYYQRIAINKILEAIVKGQNRLLLATETGLLSCHMDGAGRDLVGSIRLSTATTYQPRSAQILENIQSMDRTESLALIQHVS